MRVVPEFDEKEADAIIASVWFNMNIDYKQFSLLDEANRAADIERFANVQGIRYSILSKVIEAASGCVNCKEYKGILDRARDIMIVARGVQSGQGGAETEISGDSGDDSSGSER